MNSYIRNLIVQGEGQHLDFKFEISDTRKIARTFSAFANTEGGKLLVGVKDNGVITGIRTDEEAYMIESAAQLFCKPEVEYSVKPWNIDGKIILEVTIPMSKNKPHLAPWKEKLWRAFVRVKDENFLANSILVEVWRKERESVGVLVKYNHYESELLNYLQKNSSINMGEFLRLCKLKYPIAKKILVNLVAIGIIDVFFEEKKARYRLVKDIS